MNQEEIQTLLDSGNQAYKTGNYEEAKNIFDKVLKATEHPNSSLSKSEFNESHRANALYNIARISRIFGNYKESMDLAMQAMSLAEENNLSQLKAKVYNLLGNIASEQTNNSQAIEYYSQAIAIFEELGEKFDVANITGNLGTVYFSLSNYNKALDYFTKAVFALEELGDKQGIALFNGNIGNVYLHLDNKYKALEYLEKALKTYEEIDLKRGLAFTKGNIGVVYYNLENYDKALEYFTESLAGHKELGHKLGIALVIGDIGNVNKDRGNFSKALDCYLESLSIHEELGDNSQIAAALGNIGNLYANNQFDDYNAKLAEEYLQKAISLCESTGANFTLYNLYKYLSHFYKLEKRWEESQIYFEKFYELEKEVLNEEAKKKADQFEQLKQAAEREKEIEIAKATAAATMNATTALLHKVLPKSIATRIINSEEEIADYFTSVSILFADIEGFTPISAQMPALVVVRFLNGVFGEFDRIMQKHGCEKIKTIGDGYMAAAGVPIECADHAERMTSAAFEMIETLTIPEDIREYMPEGTKLGIRIGLHTGPVVAGVIGQDRFVYDIYSDAVNTAARMESHGVTNRVHVSAEFALHLQNRFMMTKNTNHGINFEKRGEIEIKGKGKMNTYFLDK